MMDSPRPRVAELGRRRWQSVIALVAVLTVLVVGITGHKQIVLVIPRADALGMSSDFDVGFASLRALIEQAHDVELRSPGELALLDGQGSWSTVSREAAMLRLVRSDGRVENLAWGVQELAFKLRHHRSLVDAPAEALSGELCQAPRPTGVARALVMAAGQDVALGFTLLAEGLPERKTVPEADEEVLSAVPQLLKIRAGRIQGHTQEFCHLHAEAPHVSDHSAEGGRLRVELFEARYPGDARPVGQGLAALELPMSQLPAAPYNWFDAGDQEEVLPPEVLDPRRGVAWDWWKRHADVVLNVTPTLEEVTLDLASLRHELQPGRAYTLVLTAQGHDLLVLEAADPEAGAASAFEASTLFPVARREQALDRWCVDDLQVWRSLKGTQFLSTTQELMLPERVEVRLELAGGMALDASLPTRGGGGELDGLRRVNETRRARVALGDALQQSSIEGRLASWMAENPEAPVLRYSGQSLLQDAELWGLLVVEPGAHLYLDNVVLHGAVVSSGALPGADVARGPNGPTVTVDGSVQIDSMGAVKGVAVYLPDGRFEIRGEEGVAAGMSQRTPKVQIDGDLLARELELGGQGSVWGQLASEMLPVCGPGIVQPRLQRLRQLRTPGLER